MPFTRPTLTELIDRDVADMASRVNNGAGSVLRRAVLHVLARVVAGASHLLHGHLDWNSRQMLPTTCDEDRLQEWADIFKIPRKSATIASGSVTFTGSDGATIPSGTALRRSDDARFTTTASGVIASGAVTVAVEADDAGEAGNTDAAIALSLVSPLSGVNGSGAVAAGGIIGGADIEALDDWRGRIIDRIQQAPQGGSTADYESWAKEVSGVTRAWVYPLHMGDGTVGVTFVLDGEADIIPDSGKVAEVQAYLDDRTRRPVTADLYVFAPVAVAIDPEISINPDTAEIRAAIATELADLLAREAEPGGTILLSHINEAISIAAGENDHTLVSPVANVTVTSTQIATLGTITWS